MAKGRWTATAFLAKAMLRAAATGVGALPAHAAAPACEPGGALFWTATAARGLATGAVERSRLDGSQAVVLLDLGAAGEPLGIAIDPTGSRLYWSVPALGVIQSSALDGSEAKLVPGTQGVRGIALDPAAGKVYWAFSVAGGPAGVRRSDLDGSNVEDLVQGLVSPTDVEVDPALGKIFWADNSAGKIQRAN